jgi:hypothetical protein
MANGNPELNEVQQSILRAYQGIYDKRFSNTSPSVGAGDADAPMLKDYAPDIQNLLSNDQFSGIYDATNRAAKERMLEDNGIDSKSFFEQKPDATAIDVMQATNFNGYAEKEKAYSDPSMFDREEDRANALEELKNEFDSSFQNSFLFPELGSALDELIPDYIRNDPEKRADFEKAFYHETGGIKLDFDDSGRVGDVYTDSSVGNFMRSVGYNLSDLGTEIMDGVLGTSNAVVSLFSDLGEQNEEFLQAQESGEYQSQIEAADDFWQMSDNSLFWASFSSPEARKQLYASKKNLRTVDFQALLDRGMDNSSAGELWGNGVDQLIQSAPLLLDLYTGGALAKGALKGVTKGITKRATGRAAKSAAKSKSILKQAGRANSLINTGGAIVFSDVLVASQMHADNVGQEWYDNLSTMDRASYLAHQSSAEVISGMVLNKVMMRLPPSKMTRAIFEGQRRAITEWGKNIARTTLMGITEEGVAEAGTAAWQYASEIKARQAGGDQTAYYDSKEMTRRVMDSAAAGILMGGIAGGVGAGVIRGGFSASLAKYTGNIKRSQDSLQAAAEEADNARTKAAKEAAFDRLEAMTKKHSGATSAVTRAYERLRVKNPEIFNSIVEIQGRVNALVQQYKSGTQSEVAVRGEIVSLLQEKQRLENEAFGGQHGDPTFEGVIKEEVNSIAKERGDKVKEWKQGYDSSPEAQAERALNEEIDVQKASLEAAVAANSPDQNADDDAQDTPDPTGPQAPEKETDIPEGSQTVRGTSSTPLNPDAVASTRYRAIAKRANKLMKAFKGAVSEVVVHTTAESFAEAMGEKAENVSETKGAFKGGVVHINMSNPTASVWTVRHEFLHAAFKKKSLAAKKALLKELKSVAKRYSDKTVTVDGETWTLAGLIDAVEETYKGKEGYTDSDLIEEKIVTAIEYFLDQEIFGSEPKLGQRILNAFKKFFGGEVTASELAGLAQAFRDSERTGKDFKTDKSAKRDTTAEADPTMESRNLGPSKAYPDLQNSKITYWVRQVNRLGGEMHNTKTKVFKDYWHFRNWWVQQTGNGKRAEMVGGFRYTNADGQEKTVNQPRPKLDRETGQPIDVQPLLKTINETKRESTERGFAKSDKAFNSSRAQKFISNVVNRVIDNEFNKKGDAYTLDSELVREPLEGFEVVETVEFTAEKTGRRYNTEAAEAQAKEYVQSIADMVPVGKGADYVFQVSADGDGKAKVELLVKDAAAFEQLKQQAQEIDLDDLEEGDSFSGEVVLESSNLKPTSPETRSLVQKIVGREISVKSLMDYVGYEFVMAFYDTTSGGRSGIGADWERDFLFSHSDEKSAEGTFQKILDAAIADYEKKGKKSLEGDILLPVGFMSLEAVFGNKDVVAEVISELKEKHRNLEVLEGKSYADKIIISSINEFFLGKDLTEEGRRYLVDISKGLKSNDVDFEHLPVEKGSTKEMALPKTIEGAWLMLEAINKEVKEDDPQFRTKSKLIKSFLSISSKTKSGLFDIVAQKASEDGVSVDGFSSHDLKVLLREKGMLQQIQEDIGGDINQKILYYKVFNYRLKTAKTIDGEETFVLDNAKVEKHKSAEGEKDLSFPWGIKAEEGALKEEFQSEEDIEVMQLLRNYKYKYQKKPKWIKENPELAKLDETIEKKAAREQEAVEAAEKERNEWFSRQEKGGALANAIDALIELDNNAKLKKNNPKRLSDTAIKKERAELVKVEGVKEYQRLTENLDAAKENRKKGKASAKKLQESAKHGTLDLEDVVYIPMGYSTKGAEASFKSLNLSGTGDVVKKAAKAAGKKGIAVNILEAMKAKASKVEQAIINDVIASVNMDTPEGRYVTEEQLEKAISLRMLSPLEDESEFGDYGLDRIGRDEDAVDPSLTPLVGDTDHWGEASVEHTNQEAHAHIRTSGMKSDPQSLYVLEMQSDAVQKKNKKTGRSRVDIEDEVAQLFGSTTDNEAFVEDMGRNPDKYISEINDLKTDDKGNTANNYNYWGNLRRDLLNFGGFNPDNRAGYTVNKMIEAVLSKNPTFSVDGLDLIIKHYAVAMMGAPIDVTTEQAKKIFEDRWFGEIDSDLFEEGIGDIIADTTEDLMEMYNTLKGSMANPDVQEQPLGRLEEYYKVKESLKPKPEVEKKDRPIRKLWERHVINSAIQRAREKGKKKIKIPTGRTATAIQNWVKVEELEDMVSYKNQLTTGISVIHDRYSKAGSTMQKMGLKGIKLVKDSQGFEWHEALVPAEGDALTLFSVNLKPEGTDTNLSFEPNRLNYFQAIMARLDQLFANKYANVMRLQKDIQKGIGKAVELGQDFINAETLLYGRTANDLDKLDGKVKEISKEMKDSGLTSDEVTEYLIARHARERNAVIEERNGKKDGSGMSNADADAVINGLSAERKAKLDSLAKKIDAIQKDTRDTMRKYGLETNERIDAFEGMFKNYVPLGGVAIDDLNVESTSYPTGGAGITIYGDTTKRAKGRKSMAVNVLAQVIAQNAAVHTKARKNEALSSLHNLVKANPNERVWSIKDEVSVDSENAVGVRINGEQKYIVFNDASYAKSLKNMGVEKLDVISKLMRVPAAWLRRSFTTANPEFIISNFARDIQSALFNGLAEADIPGGQIQGRHIAAKIIGRVKNTLPALIKGTFGKDMGAEMEAYFDEFKEDGGQTGWGFVKPLNQIASEIEAESTEPGKVKKAVRWMAKHSIDVVENVNDAFENSIRLAAYIEAREAGVSRAKAAELAKNITVNFNRSGELGPVANAWYLFFNASVQGTVRLARSLGTLKDVRKPDGELESWHKRLNAAQKLAFGLSLTSGMLAAVNMAMSDEDEDGILFYNKIPDYVKERNLIIMYDGKNHIKIPLPYGFNIFSNFGTAMAEVAGGQREMTEAAMFMSNSAFSSFSPISFGQSKDMAKYLQKGITPTVMKPLVEIATNETFFGGSVFRDQFPIGAPKPESELAFRSPEVIQSFFSWMNKATGGSAQVPGSVDVNPDKFWYGLEYYIGGAGQFVTRSLGTGRDMFEMMKEGEKVKMSANDFPFLRKVYGESSRYYDSDSYTENSNLISQLYKERKESDDKRSDRYAGVTKLESMRKSTEKKLKALRKKRKEARDIKNYVEKQNRIYELYEKERSLLMRFNKAFEKYHGKK